MHFAHAVGTTGIKQNAFCSSGLTGVDVRHDYNVSGISKVGVHLL
jgi:hypothetical protein